MIRFICFLSIQIAFFTDVNGHGYLKTPRSRNWVAAEDGTWNGGPAYTGIPQTESCPHCLNIKEADALCGVGNAGTTYDSFNDINGDPMPWTSQAVYEEGDEITVEAFLSTNHAGHMEMWLCPDGDDSTQECLWSNPATMIRDELYGGPADPNYPERAYFGTGTDFRFTYKLPDGLTGDQVLVQWRYITANSCIPPGYRPGNPVGNSLLELGWLRNLGMVDCVPPYSPDGSRAPGSPEQFWNCAEITIIPSGPTPPTISPAPSSSSTIVAPTSSPVDPPSPSGGYCNYGFCRGSPCDGIVEGGEWCNISAEHCENWCSGAWCTSGLLIPTNIPTSTPTSIPTSIPTSSNSLCNDSSSQVNVNGKQLSCDWIARNSPCFCDKPDVSSHCPSSCNTCLDPNSCIDSNLKFLVNRILRKCTWVAAKNTARRCGLGGGAVATHCPSTCNECLSLGCSDATKRFRLAENGNLKSCSWVRNKNTEARCRKIDVDTTCRATCTSAECP